VPASFKAISMKIQSNLFCKTKIISGLDIMKLYMSVKYECL